MKKATALWLGREYLRRCGAQAKLEAERLTLPVVCGREPVSHVGVLKHAVSVNEEPATVGGVGGVITIPGAQKKGLARRLMQHTAESLSASGK